MKVIYNLYSYIGYLWHYLNKDYQSRADIEHLRSVFMAVENGDIGMLKSLGIKVENDIISLVIFIKR